MKIILPMAGIGKRMRPHTYSTPKPLIPVAGKPIIQWLIEELIKICDKPISELAFIIGNFPKETEKNLLQLAESFNISGKIYYQKEALGTAHAIYCAEPSLDDEIIIAFTDTIFFADFNLNTNADSIIWVNKVDNPSSFGVIKFDNDNFITEFIEKPKNFVSDLAIIGIYYFRNGSFLKNAIKNLIDNKITVNGEYQLTDALENLKNNNFKFAYKIVDEWLDCGNKNATLETNKFLLNKFYQSSEYNNLNIKNSIIIPPCFIHNSVIINNSVVGPYVSVLENSIIKNSVISNSMIFKNSQIANKSINNSIIGNNTNVLSDPSVFNLGDYNEL
jgi:glucose-1-phosphate thymidylyltransferase